MINVVNRFAEARGNAGAHDNRDVLTLGKASGQTGLSKVPITEQPWMEFDGIPASANADAPCQPFLGEPPRNPGENLRFVDLCWSDVMQDSVEHVGQDVGLWAKGLVGRLLRKHEAAVKANASGAQVPLWIRRILYLLADTLLMVRFAMNFRFKEMKDLVFVKFLGDVQLYGEYSRCRGQAVRRFHELMARVEAAHKDSERSCECETPREARYVIIAHSLGSIMSLDALLYASATSNVRRGLDGAWKFPGYLRDDDKKSESKDEGRFALLDTGWIQRVRSFVTLGSPIDKYLTIWWLNYRYLLKCNGRLQPPEKPIAHFNYCDELDPVGHKLDVVQQTPGYRKVFECPEDVVFNRYSVPGVAHNKYWTDQCLFRRILDRAVDGKKESVSERPQWFRRRVYWKLLFWLYSFVPLLVLLGTYSSLSLALQAEGWRTAATAAVVFSFLGYFGRRLIDLSIWWRQVERQKCESFSDAGPCGDDDRTIRNRAAAAFRALVVAVPTIWAAQSTATFQGLCSELADRMPDWSSLSSVVAAGWPVRLALIGAVVVAVALAVRRRLPAAYHTAAVDDGRLKAEAILLVAGWLVIGVALALHSPRFLFPTLALPAFWVGQLALFAVIATAVYSYRSYRFFLVKSVLGQSQPQTITYSEYACPVRAQETPDGSSDQSQTS